VSMLHQLHCLMILSDALNKNSSMKEHEIHGLDTEPDHTFHCFDYLRQVCGFDSRVHRMYDVVETDVLD
jgi:hypothetical protein